MEMINKINVGGEDKGIGANEFLCEYHYDIPMFIPVLLIVMFTYLKNALEKGEDFAYITGDDDKSIVEQLFELQTGTYITVPNNPDIIENEENVFDLRIPFSFCKTAMLGYGNICSLRFDSLFTDLYISQVMPLVSDEYINFTTPRTVYVVKIGENISITFVNPLVLFDE